MKLKDFDFKKLNEANKEDLTSLPPEMIKDIQKNIRKGARDLSQSWENAIELVNKAYEVGYQESSTSADGKKTKINKPIHIPTPSMKGGWTQYTTLISYAVEQLAKSRGLKSTWRITKNN